MEMAVAAGEIVAGIAISGIRDFRADMRVGRSDQITTSPDKPTLFVIGQGADFGHGPNSV